MILVGDSLGVVVQGQANTLSVTMEDMLYHTKLVARAAQQALVIGDMPFMSYQTCLKDAVQNAGRLVRTGVDAVKIEGYYPDTVNYINNAGMICMGHLGLTPQSRAKFGGYKIQAKTSDEIENLVKQSKKGIGQQCISRYWPEPLRFQTFRFFHLCWDQRSIGHNWQDFD